MLADSPDEKDGEYMRRSAVNLDRSLNKIMPNFFSYWNIFYAFLLVGAATALFFIQKVEAEEA